MKKLHASRLKAGDLSHVAFSDDAVVINALLLVICGPSEERDGICALEFDADGTVSSIKIPAHYHTVYTQMIA